MIKMEVNLTENFFYINYKSLSASSFPRSPSLGSLIYLVKLVILVFWGKKE